MCLQPNIIANTCYFTFRTSFLHALAWLKKMVIAGILLENVSFIHTLRFWSEHAFLPLVTLTAQNALLVMELVPVLFFGLHQRRSFVSFI